MKTICFWDGKSHRGPRPKKCCEYDKLMNGYVRSGIPVWKMMVILDNFGPEALYSMKTHLRNFKLKVKNRR